MYTINVNKLHKENEVGGAFNPELIHNDMWMLGSIVHVSGGVITSRILRLDEAHPGVPYPHINDQYKKEKIMVDGGTAYVKFEKMEDAKYNHQPVDYLLECLEDYQKEREQIEDKEKSLSGV